MYKALMIGAHNDELEYGLGGISTLLLRQGVQVRHLLVASKWFPEIDQDSRTLYLQQDIKAGEILGVEKKNISNRDAISYIESLDRVGEILDELLDYRPDLLFIHYPEDNHVEHRAVARTSYHALTVAQARGVHISEVYAFEAGTNQSLPYIHPDISIDITETMDVVNESLMCYQQKHAHGEGLVREKKVAAGLRGYLAGCDYAEVLKIVKFPDGSNEFLLHKLLGERFRWTAGNAYGYEYF